MLPICPVCGKPIKPEEFRVHAWTVDAGGNVLLRRNAHLQCPKSAS